MNRIYLFLPLLLLVLGCTNQPAIKYQCQNGNFVDNQYECGYSACPTCNEQSKIETKEIIKFVCDDGTIKNSSADCISKESEYVLLIEPVPNGVETYWYGDYGVISSLQFGITNIGDTRLVYYSIDLDIYYNNNLLYTETDFLNYGDEEVVEKGGFDSPAGSIDDNGLKVFNQGKYIAILKFKDKRGNVFSEHDSYFYVPYEK